MKKNLTYREKLLELSNIYKINEITNYIKRKKNLTTSQLEHILKKNNVPIPKEINTSFIERNISKPFLKTNKNFSNSYLNLKNHLNRSLVSVWKNTGKAGIQILNLIPKLTNVLHKHLISIVVNSFYQLYNSKIEVKRTNKIVANIGLFIAIFAIGIIGFTIFENVKLNETQEVQLKIEKKVPKKLAIKKEKVIDKSFKVETKPKPKLKSDFKKSLEKKDENSNKLKKPSQVAELVMPNLNLKTETVLSLFDDVNYDLKTVRYKKVVKPIYFTQFPKDLDEIKDTKLKKETFIKIVLPLVVAENRKILDDRAKLFNIIKRKKTEEKDNKWLKQKFREYKIKNGDIKELEKRMDIIPASIALAQAAKESGWGTSRFALEGNAIFGQWTWSGKGIEPLDKAKAKNHKILRFPILRASVKAYKNNLNTHRGYSEFRDKRNSLRKRNQPLEGMALSKYLDEYAQTGKIYTETLRKIIEQNDLFDFESVQLTTTNKKQLNL